MLQVGATGRGGGGEDDDDECITNESLNQDYS
jgi:hypothetical protein